MNGIDVTVIWGFLNYPLPIWFIILLSIGFESVYHWRRRRG